MRTRARTVGVKVVLMVCALTVAALIATEYFSSAEPRYRGKTVSAWFEEFRQTPETDTALPEQALEALQALGPKALPFLRKQLRVRETGLTRLYRECSILLPQNVRTVIPGLKDRDLVRSDALCALYALGEDAQPAVPEVLAMMRRENEDTFAFANGLKLLARLRVSDAEVGGLVREFSRSGRSKEAKLVISKFQLKTGVPVIETIAAQSRLQY